MTEESTSEPSPFTRSVVLRAPGAGTVEVIRDRSWADADRTFDLYRPPEAAGTLPAVVFVTGFPDPGFRTFAGCALKDTAPYRSWGRLLAASGLAAVTYSNVDPVLDILGILGWLRDRGGELGIDTTRCGLWACSGNVPNALGVPRRGPKLPVGCAAFCYGYMLDGDGDTAVADAGRQFGFAVPQLGIDEIPADLPLLIARAGADTTPGLNGSIDRFTRRAETSGLDVEVAEHPTGPHAFDVLDDSDASRDVIARVVAFLRDHLLR